MMSDCIAYSISVGNWGDGKSACIWRTEGNMSTKVARFQSKADALRFAEEFDWPLSDNTKSALRGEQT